jgi:hypothetical protein
MSSTPSVLLAQARAADPRRANWGLYVAPASGAEDGLLWFPEASDLKAFVAGPLWEALSGFPAPEDTAAELEGLFVPAQPLSWALLEQVNFVLEPVVQIHWWGHVRQLYEGEDPFAKDLREAWRQSVGRGPQDFSALDPQEQSSYVDFLRSAFQ